MTPIPVNSVEYSNWATPAQLTVQHLFASRTPANTVQVTARFVSCMNTPLAIKVRTSFMDANQAPTEEPSAWQSVFLQPHLTATYTERSTSKAVMLYLIEVMPGDSGP